MRKKSGASGRRDEPPSPLALYALPSHQDRSAKSVLKIIDAAESVLSIDGFEKFSVSAVAAKANLSVGGLYRRFASKEDLLATVNDLALKRARKRFEAAIVKGPLQTAEAVVAATIAGLCSSLGEEEDLHRALYDAGRREPALFNRGLESRSRSSHAFYIMLLPHLQHIDPEAARTLIMMIWEVVMGSVLNKLNTESSALREMTWASFRAELTDVAVAYMRAKLAPPPD